VGEVFSIAQEVLFLQDTPRWMGGESFFVCIFDLCGWSFVGSKMVFSIAQEVLFL